MRADANLTPDYIDEETAAADLARLLSVCPDPDLCPGCVGACLLRDTAARTRYAAGCRALGAEDVLPPCEER